MAHQINLSKTKGTHSFAAKGEKAWHGLGQYVDQAMTAEQAIKLANLDYIVEKAPIYAQVAGSIESGDADFSPFDEKVATYRTDTNEVLGLVGGRYEIIQNNEAFGFFDAIIDKGEAIFETAGVLGKGERIFVTAKLPDDFRVNGEECNKYLMLTNSHNGSSSITVGLTTVRVVCNNTLQAALSNLQNKVSIQHKGNAKDKLAEAYRVMGIASIYMTEIEGVYNQMAKTEIKDAELKKYIEEVMRPEILSEKEESQRFKNQVDKIYEFALSHPTQLTDAARGTVWGAYNAISGYYNWEANYENNEKKLVSIMYGNANKKILKGFDKALQLI